MLYERMKKARKALKRCESPESNFKDTYYENDESITGRKETVLIGHDYIDDNDESDETLGLGGVIPDPESPNDLDADEDISVIAYTDEEDKEVEEEIKSTIINLSEYSEARNPTIGELEESMDRLEEMENPKEDTSGVPQSNVDLFLEKYANGNDIIQVLRTDLMKVLSDVQWIKESKNQHEQWALDFADALNEISVSI